MLSFPHSMLGRAGAKPIVLVGLESARGPGNIPLAVNKPSGVQEGDIMIAILCAADLPGLPGVTPPPGWTARGSIPTQSGLNVFSKVAGASEPSSYSFLYEFSAGGAFVSVAVVVYRNAEWGVIGSIATIATDIPSVTSAQNNALLIVAATKRATGAFTLPTGMRQVGTQTAASAAWLIADEPVNAGATGTRNAGASVNANGVQILLYRA